MPLYSPLYKVEKSVFEAKNQHKCWRLRRKKCLLGDIKCTTEKAAKGIGMWRKKGILP